MSEYGTPANAPDSQLAQVDFIKWLMKPTTKASAEQKPLSKEKPREKSGMPGNPDMNKATTSTSPTTDKPVKQISCVQCQQRKIKCDRAKPSCGHCIKSKLGPCEYRPPAPPRRGKRKPTETDLLSRLRRCEDLLRDSGIPVDEDGNIYGIDSDTGVKSDSPAKKPRGPTEHINGSHEALSTESNKPVNGTSHHTGNIILEEGGSRYVESDLWRGIDAETIQADSRKLSSMGPLSEDELVEASDPNGGDFLFDSRNCRTSLQSSHPSLADAGFLWTVFLENVEPLLKVLHVPTFASEMWSAARNTDNIPSSLEALMFAIYCIAVASMPAAECEKTFGIAKSTLFSKYELAVKKAFVKAGTLVSTDFKLVQAMVIWLHAIRDVYHPHALWILSGVALRMAQRAGLHKEKALANFSVFDAEMRRRTWWALMTLDTRAAELSGSGISVFQNAHDTEIPRNLNDSDLTPSMTELPPDRTGPTEMIFVALRYEVAKFFVGNMPRTVNDYGTVTYPHLTDAKIDAFEQILEHKYLRFCDALYPLHYITSIVGRACAGTMRLIMHHPCQDPDGGKNMTAEQKMSLYQQCVKLVKYQHLIQSTPALSARYSWHCDAYFPWHAFIFIITTLCKRENQGQAAESWALLHKTFEMFPKMIQDTRKPLHGAIGNLVIKAWDATGDWYDSEKILSNLGISPASPVTQYKSHTDIPEFIVKLRAQRAPRDRSNQSIKEVKPIIGLSAPSRPSQPTTPGILAQAPETYSEMHRKQLEPKMYMDAAAPDYPSFDMVNLSPEAWAEWDKLLSGSQNMEFLPAYPNTASWSMYSNLN